MTNNTAKSVSFKLWNSIWQVMREKLIVVLVVLTLPFVAYTIVTSLKWALGVSNIEAYLAKMQEVLSESEDTIFSYKYDLSMPDLSDEKKIVQKGLSKVSPEKFFSSSFADFLSHKNSFSTENWSRLVQARQRLKNAIRREFYFSSAPTSVVTLDYKLKCVAPDGRPFKEKLPFTVKVNNEPIPRIGDWRGHQTLEESLAESSVYEVVSSKGHKLRKHTLLLELFQSDAKGIPNNQVHAIVAGQIERCSFNAMIFVRDQLKPFKPTDLATWMEEKVSL